MHLTLSVIAAVATVYIVICLILFIDKRVKANRAATDKRRRQAKVLKWVRTVEDSTDHQTLANLPQLGMTDEDMHLDDERREIAAVNKHRDALYRVRSENLGLQRLENPHPYNVAYLYLICHTNSLDSWLAFHLDAKELGAAFNHCIDETLKRAQAGDRRAIVGFELLMGHQEMIVPFCKDFGIYPPRFPDNWGSIVTKQNNK